VLSDHTNTPCTTGLRILVISILILGSSMVARQIPTQALVSDENVAGPNSDPIYRQLRDLTLSSEAVAVSNLTLRRDVGTFHLRSGTVCFVMPVAGKITGAVFSGNGTFVLDPGVESERASLKLLTKEDEFSEAFSRAVFRFTDSTYAEIKRQGTATAGRCDLGALPDTQNTTRHKLKRNLEARILEDVLSSEPGGYFVAFIHGRRYSSKEEFEVDPNRESEQVNFWTYADNKQGNWVSVSLSDPRIIARKTINIVHQQLDVTFEKNGRLDGEAIADVISQRNGLRVVPLDLFPSLRVESVVVDGHPVSFIQEDKNDDADFAVVLPNERAIGERFTITTTYGGKDAVTNEGGGNYYPIAREDWYPNQRGAAFGHYARYDMTLRIPKDMKMAATGVLVSDRKEGERNVTVWKSEGPQTVAGFSFGRFKEKELKLTKPDYFIQSYANEEAPNWVQALPQGSARPPQDLSSSPLFYPRCPWEECSTRFNKQALAEAELAILLFTDYFGPPMFKHLQLTQQTACNYGQSWPELVWIPLCYYYDSTTRHALGLDIGDRGYWKAVIPHEVAHQWWGHTVGFSSGRDQWMSEGFSDFSASLYLTLVEKNPAKFLEFWRDEREMLLDRDAQGFRAIDAVTMGYRASNSRTGYITTRKLIYPKGAYILHMIRMMMKDRDGSHQRFREMMQDFVKTYSGKAATTEDFESIVEKHMTPTMDLDGNHRMDWFFNEYVYGTALPAYDLESTFGKGPDGDVLLNFRLTQSEVSDRFKMTVPIYLELANGHTIDLGRVRVFGNSSIDRTVLVKGIKDTPKRAIVNYNDDVLASN
jgi:hypothetical protein